MKHLIVLAYDDQRTAAEVVDVLWQLDQRELLVVDNVAYVTKDDAGKVHLHLTRGPRMAGAVATGLTGLVAGLLFAVPIAGAAIGAGIGALAAKRANLGDPGLDDAFVKDVGERLRPNGSAVVILEEAAIADKVVPEVARYGGTVMRTTLPPDAERRLQEALQRGRSDPGDASVMSDPS